MLLLEVKVPALCGRYDFELEESASVAIAIKMDRNCGCTVRKWNASFPPAKFWGPVAYKTGKV